MNSRLLFIVTAVFAAVTSCKKTDVSVESFGRLSTGEEASLYTVVNRNGASMTLTDYGCRVVKVCMPGRDGVMDDVIVGPGELSLFENGDRFFGPVIGRYGNRIDHAAFTLDGIRYELDANENFGGEPVQCHGGRQGFDRFLWEGEILKEENRSGIRFTRLSPDGEQGFPGNLQAEVTYWLTDENTVRIEYKAVTDKPTVVNLSNHSYFNLKGSRGGYVMEHLFQVEADTCVLNNRHFCPDKLLPVEGTPFDFRQPHRVDYRIDQSDPQLEIMHGMSACWAIRDWDGTLRKAATLFDEGSGRGVETWTTEPALLTFTGRTLNADVHKGKYGPIQKFSGMLLETIHFPDSPNQDRFPSTVLRPGETYTSVTEYRFFVK